MIIGLSGYARSGKDTVAEYLVEEHGFTRRAFADSIREALLQLDPHITIDGTHNISLASAVDKMGWEYLKDLSPDVRRLLQRMGTEVGRNLFGNNFWVDLLIKNATEASTNIVVTDVRFTNEAEAIRSWGGEVWRINRPGTEPVNTHASETELDDYPNFSLIINNDSTPEELFSELTPIFEEISAHNGK